MPSVISAANTRGVSDIQKECQRKKHSSGLPSCEQGTLGELSGHGGARGRGEGVQGQSETRTTAVELGLSTFPAGSVKQVLLSRPQTRETKILPVLFTKKRAATCTLGDKHSPKQRARASTTAKISGCLQQCDRKGSGQTSQH